MSPMSCVVEVSSGNMIDKEICRESIKKRPKETEQKSRGKNRHSQTVVRGMNGLPGFVSLLHQRERILILDVFSVLQNSFTWNDGMTSVDCDE